MMKALPILLFAIALGCKSHWTREQLQVSDVESTSQENNVDAGEGEQSRDVNNGQVNEAHKALQANESQSSATPDKEQIRTQVIGLSVSRAKRLAKSLGKDFRVVQLNGKNLLVTMDLRTERLSVAVKHGRVVSAEWR